MTQVKKIFVVDDDPDLVLTISSILEKEGYEVARAYDGVECMEKVRDLAPDLIVLDVMMPRKDGYKVCKELKKDPQLRSIPVILLTAVVEHIPTTHYSHRDGMETEADDFIDKPFKSAELLERIQQLIN